MSSDVATTPLEELCEAVIDCPHSTPVWMDQGVIVLRSSNIRNGRLDLSNPSFTDEYHYEERSKRARIQAGDLVITREAPMGEVCLIPENLKCCLGQRMVMLRPSKNKCHGKYLLYALQSRQVQNQIKSHEGTGSTVSNLRIPVLKELSIPSPSIAAQRAIAHILGTLDDKIELNRKTSETLEAMAKALFKSWFVDFDPVRSKAEGRSTGLPAEISDLFPDSFEDSELGEIPSGWSAKKIGEISQKVTTRIGERSAVVLSAVKNGTLQRSDDYFIKKVYSSSIGKYVEVLPFDIAFNPSRINIGSIGINTVVELGAVSPVYIVSRSRKNWHWFLWESISVNRVKEVIKVLCSGSVRQSLSSDDFESIQIACPGSEDLIFQFNANYEVNLSRINAINENIRLLECVRDALLPKLISGEIRIPDAEKMLEEVGV